jgi:hypothetical protein
LDAVFWYGEIRALRPRLDPATRDLASRAGRDESVLDKLAALEPALNCASACPAVALAAALAQEPDAFAAVAQPYPGAEEQPVAPPAGRLNSAAGLIAKAWTAQVRAFPPPEAPRHVR